MMIGELPLAIIATESSRFGSIEVDESQLLHMPGGILGFPDSNRYVILDHEKDSPFRWMQSVEEPDVAFVVTDPLEFFSDYHVQVKREELSNLDLKEDDDLIIMVILSLRKAPGEMTANLQGPVIVNARNRKGRQVVLKGTKYNTKHALFNLPSEDSKA